MSGGLVRRVLTFSGSAKLLSSHLHLSFSHSPIALFSPQFLSLSYTHTHTHTPLGWNAQRETEQSLCSCTHTHTDTLTHTHMHTHTPIGIVTVKESMVKGLSSSSSSSLCTRGFDYD